MKTFDDPVFWKKVNKTDTCWLWIASFKSGGYGSYWDGTRHMRAHRFLWEKMVGPIPEGLQLDHLCRVRNCVNPDHMEPVTCRENLLRGHGIAAINARKTHCKQGHPFSGDNLGFRDNGRKRKCLTCQKRWEKRSRNRRGKS